MTYPSHWNALEEGDVAAESVPWRLHRGATVTVTGVTFTVWAPIATAVSVHVATGVAAGDHALAEAHRGVWEAHVEGVRAGDRYGYRIDGGELTPDPVSRSQPGGVHGLSAVVDPDAFAWTDDAWSGPPLANYAIYELHVGTFTPEGTFAAAAARLRDLVELGVTAIELLPIGSFPGRRNWGYDGVHIYAPQASYGGPDGFKQLVEAAHIHGIAVVLDVVYNHLGPEGNYLDRFGPYFTDAYQTPWGRAVNYDGKGSDGVRRWAHDNALYWISEYHIDALRLDAVHGIFDFGALAFLEQLSDEVHELGRQLGRKVQLMAESDLNDPRLLRAPDAGGFGIDAQWADDVHHTIHAHLTGEASGYYQDFKGVASITDVFTEPFFYARRYSPNRDRVHGRSSAGVPRQRFVVAVQNHDQVGNRPNGERLASLVGPEKQRLAAALLLLSPYIPLLFMGEEYGETAPFLYFIEHGDPELVEAVRAGRKREFEDIGRTEAQVDPQAEETFARCRLDWDKRGSEAGARLRALYRDLLALRREEPMLRAGGSDALVQGTTDWMTMLRENPLLYDHYGSAAPRRAIFAAFNLTDHPMRVPVRADAEGAWKLRLSTDAEGYGGAGRLVYEIPPMRSPSDGPKRLLERASEGLRTVQLPAWSAAVYLRELES